MDPALVESWCTLVLFFAQKLIVVARCAYLFTCGFGDVVQRTVGYIFGDTCVGFAKVDIHQELLVATARICACVIVELLL